MKYIKYQLDWNGTVGKQPYEAIEANSLSVLMDGGHAVKNGWYFGYLIGSDEDCATAIGLCTADFNMTELTEAQALAYWMDVIPLNTISSIDDFLPPQYTGQAYIGEDGKVVIPTQNTPYGE